MVEPHTGRVKRRWVLVGAAVVVLLLVGLAVYVYVADYGTGNPHAERAAAIKAARQVQATTHGTFWVATYRPNAGEHQQSNTGHSCFGRTVLVRLLWKVASFGHGGDGNGPDTPQAALVTADATSGTVCFVSSSYGPGSVPTPGEIYLYGPRKDLVPR